MLPVTVTQLPTGTVTFLFTDIEGSTALLKELGRDAYEQALAEHAAILRSAFDGCEGKLVDTQGDSSFVAFGAARDAVAAAVSAQRGLATHARYSTRDPRSAFSTPHGKVRLGTVGETFDEHYAGQNNMPGPPSGYF